MFSLKLKHIVLLLSFFIILICKSFQSETITAPSRKTPQQILTLLPLNKQSLTIDVDTIEIKGFLKWNHLPKIFHEDFSWKEFHIHRQKNDLLFEGVLWRN
ncbi:MAG: hypothetical protein CMF41_01425 [Legionellales bacterium]|nr:hypothetical protein [Legionellales bacterium]OUX66118.1 MAG: hypothetical protein CBE41_00635 [Gammaproteobacteria bacterium TMED281]|tara:strand:- start:172 stop:474 length:303 start_codon:yes stop_codon:yes gene_type:complete